MIRLQNICMTAPSWPDFLERHADAVTKEVERRCATHFPGHSLVAKREPSP